MGESGARFTAWLSDTERRALENLANKNHCTVNYLIRAAIREQYRTEVKAAAKERLREVTAVTGNR